MKPQAFIDLIAPAARECHRKTGIPASFTIAQSALESGWGTSLLSRSGCNLFGVKADPAWHGAVTMMPTKEFENGKPVMVDAKWRCYATWGECLDDRARFFRQNPRYAACFKETTGEGWAQAVAACGYATDPEYAAKLIATIRARKLAQFDQPETPK